MDTDPGWDEDVGSKIDDESGVDVSGDGEDVNDSHHVEPSVARQGEPPETHDPAFEPEPNSAPVEAGQPNVENVVFVTLGAITMVLVLVQLARLVVVG